MKQFEYDFDHPGDTRRNNPLGHIDSLRALLNQRGKDGWKYKTTIVYQSDSFYLFEREIEKKESAKK